MVKREVERKSGGLHTWVTKIVILAAKVDTNRKPIKRFIRNLRP
jgi:hypothetical protein